MSTASGEPEKASHTTRPLPKSRKLIIVVGSLIAILIVGLSLDLGLGLGLHKSANTGATTSNSTTATIVPSPTPFTNGSQWQPAVQSTFNYQLSVVPASDNPHGISVWFIDLFTATPAIITGLQRNGAKVVCYFSAGSSEDWRPDYHKFDASDLGANLTGWKGERWLNTNSANVRAIMAARMDLAVSKKCDGVDPDNMDAYDNGGGGLNLTEADATDYAKSLAVGASTRSLSIGLKNAAAIIPNVIDAMQWSVNEQCVNQTDCSDFSAFIKTGKPVFNVEYPKGDTVNNTDAVPTTQLDEICDQQKNDNVGFTTILKNMNLDTWIEFCNGTSVVLD